MKILIIDNGNLELREVLKTKFAHVGLGHHEVTFACSTDKYEIINHTIISYEEGEKLIGESLKKEENTITGRLKEIVELQLVEHSKLIHYDNSDHRGKHRTHKNKYGPSKKKW